MRGDRCMSQDVRPARSDRGVIRTLAAQRDPALRVLAGAKILRQVWAICESRQLGPGPVGRELRDEDVRGVGEDFICRPHRRARAGPQIVAVSRGPAQHEGEGIHLVEDNDAAVTMAIVAQQGSRLDDRLDIFGG
jgi:hypothetical protein